MDTDDNGYLGVSENKVQPGNIVIHHQNSIGPDVQTNPHGPMVKLHSGFSVKGDGHPINNSPGKRPQTVWEVGG